MAEGRLRVFENRILRRIFWSNKDANEEWSRLHNEELHSLYLSPNIIRAIKSRIIHGQAMKPEESRSALNILTGTPTGKRYLGRLGRRCKDNIRMDLKEMGIKTRNWVDSSQDKNYWKALVNAVLNLWVP